MTNVPTPALATRTLGLPTITDKGQLLFTVIVDDYCPWLSSTPSLGQQTHGVPSDLGGPTGYICGACVGLLVTDTYYPLKKYFLVLGHDKLIFLVHLF